MNVENIEPAVHNPQDPVSGFAGIPRNMTGLGTVLARGGYACHQVGKWDAGMATPDHSPLGRGYVSSFGYFHHDNDYWDETAGTCNHGQLVTDLWRAENGEEHPATHFNGSSYVHNHTAHVPAVEGSIEDYEEWKFGQHVLSLIGRWANETADAELGAESGKRPLFINYDSHVAHEPLHVPQTYYEKFAFIENDYENHRRIYASMVHFLDDVVGNVTDALKANGMWENTLWVGWSDNGGPTWAGSSHTANNYPLRGSKGDNFEGGVRVNAYVGGGWFAKVAPKRVGTVIDGIAHLSDLYATFAGLAGVDPTDKRAEAAGLPPIDAVDLMPYWTGNATASPRTRIHHDPWAITIGDLKLLFSTRVHQTITPAQPCWTGPLFPNASLYNASPSGSGCDAVLDCSGIGCLFNVSADPGEHFDISTQPGMEAHLEELTAALFHANQTLFNPDRGKDDGLACEQVRKNKGFWGPFLP